MDEKILSSAWGSGFAGDAMAYVPCFFKKIITRKTQHTGAVACLIK
jgi:hypothetical protein